VNDIAFPLWLSLRVAAFATALVLPLGILVADLQARRRYPGHGLVTALVLLPLVLPPTVTGYYLVMLLGHGGPLGGPIERLTGAGIMFTFWACAAAASVMAFPLVVRTVQGAFESLDPTYEEIATTLGTGRLGALVRVRIPLAWRAIVAAVILAFARALGEFGATMMLAGNVPGRTNTMPLEVYSAYLAGDDARAHALVIVLTAVSAVVVVLAERLARRGGGGV
jgi:molybdate transport system permease protein